MKDKNFGRIIFLDYLRIFAFTSVLIGHKFYADLLTLSNNDLVHESLRFIIKLSLPLFEGGGAGVIVFFLVSGYIITHVLQPEQPLEFLIKRLFRIYPLYLVSVLLQCFFLSFIYHTHVELQILVPQMLLIGDFFNTPHALNGVEGLLHNRLYALILLFITSTFLIKFVEKPGIHLGRNLLNYFRKTNIFRQNYINALMRQKVSS